MVLALLYEVNGMEYVVSPDTVLALAGGVMENLSQLLGPGISVFLLLAGGSLLSRLLRMFWQ